MRVWFAHLLLVIGHWFISRGTALSIEAYESNFDGEFPFGHAPKEMKDL